MTTNVMSELENRVIRMPVSGSSVGSQNLALRDRVLVIIGANGSGKTRLGCKLEKENGRIAHRVSAHRALVFPENVRPMDLDIAERMVLIGRKEGGDDEAWKINSRWSRSPEVALLNDFDHLVTYMVSESFSVSDKYRVAMKASGNFEEPPATRLDLVKEVWEEVLPSRQLIINGSRIRVSDRNDGAAYHAKDMSDGERGVFHLIGEAMSVPQNGVFIVDEPELHLHRSIQSRLWDAVETARPDCIFVYITHDLGFAASRREATKVWLKEFREGEWDWEEIPEAEGIPEPLLLEVFGARRPVLFVEGDKGSLDYLLYSKAFPGFEVIPCGSCETVIRATCSFGKLSKLHHSQCHGLIDNDGRPQSDIDLLATLNVSVLPVSLVENLFMTEQVLKFAAQKLGHNAESTLNDIQNRVFQRLERNNTKVISNLTRQGVEVKLRVFGQLGDGKEQIVTDFEKTCEDINPGRAYDFWETEIKRVLEERDYGAALRLYKIKGLSAEAGAVFSTRFEELIVRWLRMNTASELIERFKLSLPSIVMESQTITACSIEPASL